MTENPQPSADADPEVDTALENSPTDARGPYAAESAAASAEDESPTEDAGDVASGHGTAEPTALPTDEQASGLLGRRRGDAPGDAGGGGW